MSVAVVVGTRHGQHGPRSRSGPAHRGRWPGVLELHPLSQEATATLVRSLLRTDTDDDLCRACHAATGGNPFLVDSRDGARRRRRSSADGAALRVGRLVPDAVARQVLSDSAARRGCDPRCARGRRARRGHATPARRPPSGVDPARGRRRSRRARGSGHPLARRVALVRASAACRSRLCGRPPRRASARARACGEDARRYGSPPERVALQLLAAEPAGSEWAVEMLREAAREAGARGAPRTAARYLERALAEPPAETDRRDVLFELGVAESRATPSAADSVQSAGPDGRSGGTGASRPAARRPLQPARAVRRVRGRPGGGNRHPRRRRAGASIRAPGRSRGAGRDGARCEAESRAQDG